MIIVKPIKVQMTLIIVIKNKIRIVIKKRLIKSELKIIYNKSYYKVFIIIYNDLYLFS